MANSGAGDRMETHFWCDGKVWCVYSERAADIRRFTEWLGSPARTGRDWSVAWWEGVPADTLRVRRRVKRAPLSAEQAAASKARLAEFRAKRG